jgi:hypothetical protein
MKFSAYCNASKVSHSYSPNYCMVQECGSKRDCAYGSKIMSGAVSKPTT